MQLSLKASCPEKTRGSWTAAADIICALQDDLFNVNTNFNEKSSSPITNKSISNNSTLSSSRNNISSSRNNISSSSSRNNIGSSRPIGNTDNTYDTSRKLFNIATHRQHFTDSCAAANSHTSRSLQKRQLHRRFLLQLRSVSSAPAYAPLEKVYSDILYNREPGQGAYSYTITFIDAATRYIWHLNLPSKDMAFEAFIAWLPVAERESGEKLKSLQSDGGGEYTSQRFKQFLAEKGIKRLISLPYAYQQQGVAERMNRTLQNTMRKLLRGMRLPNHQWPEAMDHAVMLHNLLSSSSLPNNASPHLLWTGKQGSTKMLRVFGCMVQYRPPSARAGRFSQRAQWGLLLGIEKNYNAWKIFDVHSKETVAARDVFFYERLTLPTYLANLEENQNPTGGFLGDRHFASAADEADWDEQNVDNASNEAGPLPYYSVPIPMDDENPRESVNAETYFDLADT
ncbi:unnamed protein product, partial [Closterium sp. NIES-54]